MSADVEYDSEFAKEMFLHFTYQVAAFSTEAALVQRAAEFHYQFGRHIPTPQPGGCRECRSKEAEPSGFPTENARRYAREFAAEQLRKAATWAEAEGYDEAAVDHLIVKAQELWP